MSEQIELSNGGWAILRDPAAVSVRLRRPVEKALMAIAQGKAKDALDAVGDVSDDEKASKIAATLDLSIIDQFNDLNDLLILARLESWSLDIPITLDSILDLPEGDYKLLQEKSSVGVTSMIPNFGVSQDPNSPIKPSDV